MAEKPQTGNPRKLTFWQHILPAKSIEWRLDREFVAAGKALLDRPQNHVATNVPRPPTMAAFYSPKVDTCVQVEVDELRTSYEIRDVTHGFMRDYLSDEGFDIRIFHCGPERADSAILTKVREFHGYVADKGYPLWQDDGDGGLPATVKTPARAYSRSDCERLLKKKLGEL
jgi:hypothetical protein